MAWAITIHKSQGLTLNKATIDIGRRERQGLTFTTILRVKNLNNLRIDPPFPFERYSKMKYNTYTTTRKKEEARLQLLSPMSLATKTNITSTEVSTQFALHFCIKLKITPTFQKSI
jgi:hypothetical protein